MKYFIYNDSVKNTDQAIIDDIKAFMANKPMATGSQLLAGVPALQGKLRGEQEQAIEDSGFRLVVED